MSIRVLSLSLLSLLATPLLQAGWRPVTPEELSATKSALDPHADAEAIFRDVRIVNEAATFGYPVDVITEYVRLKIYTARGKEKYGTVQIPYWGKNIISGVEGRTIKADGTVLDLKKDAIFDKVLEKQKGFKIKVVSFAMPGVEPGAVIEYRWNRNVGEFINRYTPLDVQSEYPVRELVFHLKAVSGSWVHWPNMRLMPFGCNPESIVREANGFTMVTLHNIPAFIEEPWMPPEYSAKQWILVYYEENDNAGKDKFWKSLGRELYSDYSSTVKVNGDVKNLAAELVRGASTDDEKILRLFQYCQKNLKNIHGDEITTQEREAAKENKNTADTLARKAGTGHDINLAFAALAIAAGYDARLAKLSARNSFLFNPKFQSAYFLNAEDIAVKVNGSWKFYDVNNRHLPAGRLSWPEQGVFALITDPKDPQFVMTPLIGSKDSALQRIGTFTLSAEGELEGDVRQMYTGNKAAQWHVRLAKSNDAEREENLRDELKERFPEFELSDVKFHVPADLKGISVTYHIKVAGYAQHTGKRLFVTPAYFESGYASRFPQETRKQSIYFEYPWSETDIVTLQLPEGYHLDHPDAPSNISFPPVGDYNVKITVTNKNVINYTRQLTFGSDQLLIFDAKAYPLLKHVFDRVHEGDSHMLTLKPATETAQIQ